MDHGATEEAGRVRGQPVTGLAVPPEQGTPDAQQPETLVQRAARLIRQENSSQSTSSVAPNASPLPSARETLVQRAARLIREEKQGSAGLLQPAKSAEMFPRAGDIDLREPDPATPHQPFTVGGFGLTPIKQATASTATSPSLLGARAPVDATAIAPTTLTPRPTSGVRQPVPAVLGQSLSKEQRVGSPAAPAPAAKPVETPEDGSAYMKTMRHLGADQSSAMIKPTAEATRTGEDTSPALSHQTVESALRAGLSDMAKPDPSLLMPESKFGKAAYAVGSMAAHPVNTAVGMATMPLEAAWTLGKYTRQSLEATRGAQPTGEPITRRDAAFAAGQLLVLGLTPGVAQAIDGVFGAGVAKAARAAMDAGESPTRALLAGYAARTAAHAALGGVAGAAFMPNDPESGAILGAAIGGIHAAAQGLQVRVPVAGANLSGHPDRLLNSPQSKAPTATATVADRATTPTEPDYHVEPLTPAAETPSRATGTLPTDEGVTRAAPQPSAAPTSSGIDHAAVESEIRKRAKYSGHDGDEAVQLYRDEVAGNPASTRAAAAPEKRSAGFSPSNEQAKSEAGSASAPRPLVPESSGLHVTEDQMLTRNIARGLKTAHPDAIAHAAPEMAQRVPDNAVLVPLPDHTGSTVANAALAEAIARHAGADVSDVLGRSTQTTDPADLRAKGKPGLTADEHEASMVANGDLPTDRPVVFVDNVETTGATAEGARRVIGRPDAQLVAFAKAPIPAGEQRAVAKQDQPNAAEANTLQASPSTDASEASHEDARRVAGAATPAVDKSGHGHVPEPTEVAPRPADSGAGKSGLEAQAAAAPAQAEGVAPPDGLAQRPHVAGPVGRQDHVHFSDGSSVKTRYRVIEADQLQPSHDPTSFASNPAYPKGVQGREYSGTRGATARQHVELQTGKLRPAPLLDAGGGTTDGPPVITPHGITVAGNQGAMMLRRATSMAPDRYQAYRDELTARAASFGFDPEHIRAMTHPTLVREIHDASVDTNDSTALARMNQLSDQTPTKTKDALSDAMGRAKQMQQAGESLAHFNDTIDTDDTIRDYLSTASGAQFVRKLFSDGVIAPQERGAFVDANGSVTPAGKDAIEAALRVAAIGDPDVIHRAPASILRKLESALPAIIQANGTKAYALTPDVQSALDLLSRVEAMKADMLGKGEKVGNFGVTSYLEQQDAFGSGVPESTADFAMFLERAPKAAITAALREYATQALFAADASQSEDMFGHEPVTKPQLARRLFIGADAPRVAERGTPYQGQRPLRATGIPLDATVLSSKRYDAAVHKGHPDYAAAKAGDLQAAVRYVRDQVDPDTITKAREAFGNDAIYIAPVAIERSGTNAIPQMMAEHYSAATGARTDQDIVQANRAFHTGANAMERLISPVRFDGPVESGARYVLVDDVVTSGGTLAALADYIQARGGKVAGLVTLANASRSGDIHPPARLINELERRYGDVIREEFGIDPSSLTAEEARYLIGFRHADELRARAAAARQARAERIRAAGIRGPGAEGPNAVNEAELPYSRSDSAPAATGPQGRFYGQSLWQRKTRYTADQFDLFSKAQQDPTGPDAVALDGSEATTAFGSVATRDRVARELEPHAARIRKAGMDTADERRALVDQVRAQPWVDLTGADISTLASLRAAVSVMRHPLAESMTVLFRGNDGRTAEHFIYSSGALNMIQFDMPALIRDIVDRAKALGVTQIIASHNHPSGDPSFTDLDHLWSIHLGAQLQNHGISLVGHMTIDHDTADWATPGDAMHRGKMDIERIEIPGVDAQAWQTMVQRGAVSITGENVAQMTRDAVSTDATTVFYRDAQGRILAAEGRPVHESASETIAHVNEQRGMLAAYDVILAAPKDRADTYRQVVQADRQKGLPRGHFVTDILEVTPNGSQAPIVRSSAASGSLAPPNERTRDRLTVSELGDAKRIVPNAGAGRLVGGEGRSGTPAPGSDTGGGIAERGVGTGVAGDEGGRRIDPSGDRTERAAADVRTQNGVDQAKPTGTPEFKRWFGDSKVVDDEGRPLVVYHGTNQNIEAFSKSRLGANTGAISAKAFFFTEHPDEAGEYAGMSARKQVSNAPEREANMKRLLKAMDRALARNDHDLYERLTAELEESEHEAMTGQERGANIMPVHLRIENPLVVDMKDAVDLHGLASDIKRAKATGHDGLRLHNVFDPVQERAGNFTTTQWVAFDPKQIKSATGNSGAFDPHDASIVREQPTAYGDAAEDEYATGVKNAVSAETRKSLGMGERIRPEPRTQKEMYDAGKAAAVADPTAITRLLATLRDNPEHIVGTKTEAGLLLKHRVDLDNKLNELVAAKDAAIKAEDEPAERLARLQLAEHREAVKEFVQLAERTGTASGRALAARKMMSKLDYSLSHMETMAEAAKGSSLTHAELDRIKALHDDLVVKLAAAEKDVAAANERAAEAEADLSHAQLRAVAMQPIMDRVSSKLGTAADAAKARLRARGLRAMAGLDPADLADHAIIGAAALARGIVRFADWSQSMKATFGDEIAPHLRELFDASNARLNAELKKARALESRKKPTATPKGQAEGEPDAELKKEPQPKPAPISIRARLKVRLDEGASMSDLRPYLRQLALEHIRKGILEREPLLDALYKDVLDTGAAVTRQQVRDTLSGYGEFRPLDKSADKAKLRDIQAEAQKLAQLEALQKGQAPLATGFERQEPNAETRKLMKQVNDAKKAAGLTHGDDASRLKSALGAAKTRMRNAIADLRTEIDTGERQVKGKHVLIGDTELDQLRAELAELRKQETEVFGDRTLTDEQRLARAITAAKRTADLWQDRAAAARQGTFASPNHLSRPTSPELEAIRAKADLAREEYAELRSLDPEQQQLDDQKANQRYRANLAKREAELLDRIARADYSPRALPPGTRFDRESIKRKADVEEVKQRYQEHLRKFEKANRTVSEKVRDAGLTFVRAGALSWPTVIAKLTSVALSRIVTTPLSDAAALVVSNALPRLALGAPRYGTRSPLVALHAEAAAQTAMWTDGLADAGRLLQNKQSRLTLMHGKHKMPHEWYEYFGSLHAALKEPIKRAEYARALYRGTVDAMRRGENTTDEFVKLRLSTEAYLHAQRAVAMNDNVVVNAWNDGLRRLEQKDKTTGKANPLGVFLATALKTDMPIVKAPTNVILDASEFIGGLPIGAARAAWAYAHGIEDLQPVERDSIIRMMSKGLVGMALMALYFYKHDNIEFGGFYQPGEKRTALDVPADGARIGSRTITKSLLHNPLFMAGQFAATIARVAPTRVHRRDEDPVGYGQALVAASVGLVNEVPIISSLVGDTRSLTDPKKRDEFVAKKVASIAVPGVVQWIAKQTDSSDVIRKPVGLKQHLEYNLPVLRKQVPVDERKQRIAERLAQP
jgi:predicted amidophosphoribosyltransferase